MNFKRNGIALVTVLYSLILILFAGSLTLFLVSRGLMVTGSQTRYSSAFEAAEGGIDIGVGRVYRSLRQGADPSDTFNVKVGNYNTEVEIEYVANVYMPGVSEHFARGYLEPHIPRSADAYLTRSRTQGGERVTIEILSHHPSRR